MTPFALFTLLLSISAAAGATPCNTASPEGTITIVVGITCTCTLGTLTFDNFSVTSAPPGTTIFLSALGTGIVGTEVGLGFQITTPTAD